MEAGCIAACQAGAESQGSERAVLGVVSESKPTTRVQACDPELLTTQSLDVANVALPFTIIILIVISAAVRKGVLRAKVGQQSKFNQSISSERERARAIA
jgi:hypothetical protein